MPPTGATSLRPRARARTGDLALGAALAVVYLYSFPYFAGINSANELPRVYLTLAMVDRGALDIGPEMARYAPTPDTSTYEGRLYCNKPPGMSLLGVPVYLLAKLVHGGRPDLRTLFLWLRIGTSALPSLLFLWVFWRLLGRLVPERGLRRLLLAAYGAGTMALVYGTLLLAHQLSAALAGTALALLFFDRRGEGQPCYAAAAGLAAGAAVLVDYQTAFIGPALFAYALARPRRRLRAALHFAAGAALPLAALLVYHYYAFGSPFRTGYDYPTNPVFARWHARGFLGLDRFRPQALYTHFLSPDGGLFYYSPFLVLALPGLGVLGARRETRAEALLAGYVILFFAWFISSIAFVSGWDVGPRYITCALPFYMLPVAACARALRRIPSLFAPAAGLMGLSIVIYLAVAAVFPHYPDNFSNPLFDVTWRFGAAGYLPYNAGWLAGLQGVASVLPYAVLGAALTLACVFAALPAIRPLGRAAALAAALATGGGLLGLYYQQLACRARPVPYDFLPWMDSIWEPRHPGLDVNRLLRRIGPAGPTLVCRIAGRR